jgi:hypothetical protein
MMSYVIIGVLSTHFRKRGYFYGIITQWILKRVVFEIEIRI